MMPVKCVFARFYRSSLNTYELTSTTVTIKTKRLCLYLISMVNINTGHATVSV